SASRISAARAAATGGLRRRYHSAMSAASAAAPGWRSTVLAMDGSVELGSRLVATDGLNHSAVDLVASPLDHASPSVSCVRIRSIVVQARKELSSKLGSSRLRKRQRLLEECLVVHGWSIPASYRDAIPAFTCHEGPPGPEPPLPPNPSLPEKPE